MENELSFPIPGALVRVERRLPLQEQPVRFDPPISDADDGIERQAGVIRQENNGKNGAQQAIARIAPEARAGGRRMNEKPEERCQDRPQHQARHQPAPQHRHRREEPAHQEERDRCRRDEAAAQIVEDLPLVEGGKRVRFRSATERGDAPLQPIDDLPVAANPAMLPVPPADVTARKNIQQLDIGRQPHPHMAAFQQIVTEQVRLGKSSRQEAVKGLQFVDAFAVIAAFADQILVNIGDSVRVGIDSARIGEDAREPCRPGARQRGADAGLNDRVTANHPASIRRETRLIQRMSQRFNHPSSGVSQQLRVSIEGDDKPNALQLQAIARVEKSFQLGRGFAGEESIELFQLAALAFPADPALLALAPRSPAMKKKKPSRSVPAIQFLHPASREVDVFRVLRHGLARRVSKIGQEGKAQICIRISEESDFEAVELVLNGVRGGE